jgi:hypothetical protein
LGSPTGFRRRCLFAESGDWDQETFARSFCDFAVVRALRADGRDVLAVGETGSRPIGRELIEQANREQRILLTEGKDFGWLVFVSQAESAGVILI